MPREASLPSHRSPAAPYARPPPPLPSTSSPGSAPAAQLRSPPPLGSPRDLGGSPRLGVGGVVQPVRPRSSPLPPTLGAGAAGGGSPRMTLRGNDVGPTGNVSLASRPGGSPAPALSPALSTHSPTFHPSPLGLAGSSDHGPTSLASAAAVLMSSRDPLPSIPESPSPRTLDASVPRPSSTAPTSLIAEAMNGVEAAAQNTGPTRSPDYDTADSSHHHTPYASAPGSAARSSASSTPQPVMQTKTPTQTSTIPPQSVAVPQTPAHVQRQCTPMQVVPTAGAGPAPTAGPGQGSASAKKPGACAECRRLKLGCDRVWPCASCKRRKVSHLCPDGQLESKEINHAQRQIKGLLDRIGALERTLAENDVDFVPFNPRDDPTFNFEALPGEAGGVSAGDMGSSPGKAYKLGESSAKAADTSDMMDSTDESTGDGPSGEKFASESEPTSGSKGKGTLIVDENGTNRFTGGQASSEHAIPMKRYRSTCIPDPSDEEIAPFLETIPSAEEARVHIHNYFVNCDWMHRLLEEEKFMRDWTAYFVDPRPPIQRMPRHKLAVGLLVISLGCISEMSPTDPLDRPDSWVKGAQLCLGGLGVGFTVGVTLDTVAGLNLLAQYLLNADARESASAAWNVIGVALRLCQSMGLHYSGTWDEPEISYRQRLWWETIAMDRFLSLSLGRPYMARSSQTVWPIVLDSYGYVREGVKRSFAVSDFTQPSSLPFHWFKYRLCIILDQCLNDLDSPFLPRRDIVTRVDNSLKEIVKELPPFLVPPTENDVRDPFAAMMGVSETEQKKIVAQSLMFELLVHTTHLALHRPYFVEELKETDQPSSQSFEQCVASSRKLTDCLRQCRKHLHQLSTFWKSFIGETFTAAVVQATTIIAAPTAREATIAWSDLRDTHDLFSKYACEGHGLASRTLHTLETLVQDTEDFSPTSPVMANPGRAPKRKKLHDGSILIHSGINLQDLLHVCSRFVRESEEVADVHMNARPPWLKVRPPRRTPHNLPEPADRQPGAPAARYATQRLDGANTNWPQVTHEFEANHLGSAPRPVVAAKAPVHAAAPAHAVQTREYRPLPLHAASAAPANMPSTSHHRRRAAEVPRHTDKLPKYGTPGAPMRYPSHPHHQQRPQQHLHHPQAQAIYQTGHPQAQYQQQFAPHPYHAVDTSGWDAPGSSSGMPYPGMVHPGHPYGEMMATTAPSDVRTG